MDNSYNPDYDILRFFNDSFQAIKETHPLRRHIPISWPPSYVVDALVRKSSGQFIYASTVIKYISAIRASPTRQLDIILGVRPARSGDIPFVELDALYAHILSSVEDRQLMLDILALLMNYFVLGTTRPSDISQFLGVDPEDVDIVLSSLASITATNVHGHVSISHASLSDFLSDHTRGGNFHIAKSQYSARLTRKGIKWIRSQRETSFTLDLVAISEEVFAPPRLLEFTEDLYQDLESLPLDLIEHHARLREQINRSGRQNIWKYLLFMFKWLQAQKIDNTVIREDPRHQKLCISCAKRLKPLIVNDYFNDNIRVKHFPALMETLIHDFTINGTRYDTVLAATLNEWAPTQNFWHLGYTSEGPVAFSIFKTIGLSAMNAGENPYTHTAFRIVKSLIIPTNHTRDDLQFFRRLSRGNHGPLAEYGRKPKRRGVNTGKINKIHREIRLRKLQNGIRSSSWESYSSYSWNRDLVSKLLIPILDQCPKSEELLALINRRIKHVILKYTARRHLRDAVYRYIHRTSDAGNY